MRLLSARSGSSDIPGKIDKEKGALEFLIDLIAHRIGVFVLGLLSGGRFKGESGFAWGGAVVVGGLILLSPFVAFIAVLIYSSGR